MAVQTYLAHAVTSSFDFSMTERVLQILATADALAVASAAPRSTIHEATKLMDFDEAKNDAEMFLERIWRDLPTTTDPVAMTDETFSAAVAPS